MLPKILFLAMAAVGVMGRTSPDKDAMESMFPTAYCGEDSMPQVTAALATFKECKKGIYTDESNVIVFRHAFATNDYGLIFKTYCANSQTLKTCSLPVYRTIGSCISSGMLRTAKEYFSKFIDFVCEKEGARMFTLYKKGPKCMEEQKLAIASCEANKLSGIKKLVSTYGNGPAVPDNEVCTVELAYSVCEMAAFKACSEPEPGIIAEDMHNLLTSHLQCGQTTTTDAQVTAALQGKLQ